MTTAADYGPMAKALRLAERGLYGTDPNPRVGCVLVRDGVMVGKGWHVMAGGPHAEVHALRQAGERARGATVYVTLEPCCHHGRTPPCTEALIAAGVARVVCAMRDPNPRVAGQGLEQLAAAGIAIECGLMQAEAERLNPGFIQRMRHGRPLVRVKTGMSLDGRTALASGASRWITSPEARRDVQRLRARSSAIATGMGTVLADDPALTVRRDEWLPDEAARVEHWRTPLRVVFDSRLRLSPAAQLLGLPGRTIIYTATAPNEAWERLTAAGAELMCFAGEAGRVDLGAALQHLAETGANEVLFEAGPILSGALLQARLVDELVIYWAPRLLGDAARGAFRLPVFEQLDQAIELDLLDVRQIGPDLRLTARMRQGH